MDPFSCPLCEGADARPVFDRTVLHPRWFTPGAPPEVHLRYVACSRCGHVTMHPRLSFEEVADNYRASPTPTRESQDALRVKIYAERVAFVERQLEGRPRSLVVEVGAAYGDFLRALPGFARRVGVEPSETYRAYHDRTGDLEIHATMLEHLAEEVPDLAGHADLVVASHVLEHAEDPRRFVRDLGALARPGGLVYLEVPSIEAMARCDKPLYQTIHVGHVSQFSVPTLQRLCICEGLTPVAIETTARHDYPVVRGVFERAPEPSELATLFEHHGEAVHEATRAARATLDEVLNSSAAHTLVWGCGQDLLDVLDTFTEAELAEIARRATLVDASPDKQGRTLRGLEILAPEASASRAVGAVVITSRSELLQADIEHAARELLDGVRVARLYPLNA